MNQNKILLMCSVGFILQMYMLIMQYKEYKTVVNTDYESSAYHSIRTITICLPKLLSMKRVVEYFQRDNSSSELSDKVTKAYELYQTALVNFSSIENNNMTRKEFMKSIYEDNFESLVPNLTLMQLYEMSWVNTEENHLYLMISGSQRYPDGSESFLYHHANSSIESILLGHQSSKLLRKCFTFFCHLDKQYTDMNVEMFNMDVTIEHDETSFPLSLYNDNNLKISYAIHSGNSIPQDHDQFEFFDQNKYYKVEYNRLKIQLLKSPYKTNCQDYDQSGRLEEYRKIPLVPGEIRRDFRVFWRSGNYTGRELNEIFSSGRKTCRPGIRRVRKLTGFYGNYCGQLCIIINMIIIFIYLYFLSSQITISTTHRLYNFV